MRADPFAVTRHGVSIDNYPIKHRVSPGIKYNMLFAEWDACVGTGLDLWKWNNGEYPDSFKELVIAFYGLRNSIKTHVEDAKARVQEKMSKKKK